MYNVLCILNIITYKLLPCSKKFILTYHSILMSTPLLKTSVDSTEGARTISITVVCCVVKLSTSKCVYNEYAYENLQNQFDHHLKLMNKNRCKADM